MSESPLVRSPEVPERGRRFTTRFGPFVVLIALVIASVSFLIFADYTPIEPKDSVILGLFVANIIIIAVLIGLVVAEAWALLSAWRARVAGARLHVRIVSLFSIIAAIPLILMALVGSVTLERSLNPTFIEGVYGFILNTIDAAQLFREAECKSLLQEASLTAADLDRYKLMFSSDRQLFIETFASRAKYLGFTAAAMLKPDGTIIEKIETGASLNNRIHQLERNDFDDARNNEPVCLTPGEGKTFEALRPLSSYDDTFLYVARPVNPFTVEFPKAAERAVAAYHDFDNRRRSIRIAFATMYVSISLIMLLAATWLGLSFANTLVAPIRRLIAATDQVATGNLDVQVPIHRSEGDLAHLGETFNKMTSELRLQQNRLVAASSLIDERRVFTEAVLSGVPVAVVGVGPKGTITAINPSAERLMAETGEAAQSLVGQAVGQVFPEIESVLTEARGSNARLVQGQIGLSRAGRDRLFNVRVTSDPTARADKSYVVTLDDITDLVSAQRTAAWADVARRIAHEIKNPLTPIQLSAERLRRKYGRLITQDRDIFDQCTDTIVRQVDDIKRMVDEFSSFARMPKARLENDDLAECVRRVLFLMRVAHPDIVFEDALPVTPILGRFDRRLLSQALTNIIKNATEGISAQAEEAEFKGQISVSLARSSDDSVEINVIDNGKGFPKENRQRLLEPYMTTRAEGTGLGLPIVAKILEDHGGGIELLDAPSGRGARVKLFFPFGKETHIPDVSSDVSLTKTANQRA